MEKSKSTSEMKDALPNFRIWLCGTFRVERRVGTTYEVIRTADWGGSSYPRLLLKALLSSSGRQARREALIEMLWSDIDLEQAVQNLNTATTKLRKVLQPVKGQKSLLLTEDDSQFYQLERQHLLWTDVDEALASLREVERLGRTSSIAFPLLEKAAMYLGRGVFLEEEGGVWASSRRATVDRVRYRCRLWLVEAYQQQDMLGQAETILSALLEEDPFDEDVLCRLMSLLHQQGMTHQAIRLYEQAHEVFTKEGMDLTEATKLLSIQLREERHPVQHIAVSSTDTPSHDSARVTLDSIQCILGLSPLPVGLLAGQSGSFGVSNPIGASFSSPSLFRTDNDVLASLSTTLNNLCTVEEREVTYFDQQTRVFWRAREETALPANTLYAYVLRHIDDITALLARSRLPILRQHLYETVCRTVLLAGVLLYDMGQYTKARQCYQTAFLTAREADNTVLQAIVWGWRSFTWTYAKQYPKALRCVQRASFFASRISDIMVQAWLGAIEAEIQAHLHNSDACLQALNNMERGIGIVTAQETSYLFECNSALLLGYKGVCLQQMYQQQKPTTYAWLQEAEDALEQALASQAPLKRKLYYLSDLAGVYARQGEVEKACAYAAQCLPLVLQVGSGSKTIHKHLLQVRALLQPNERTSSVQALDEQMRVLISDSL